MNTDKLAVMANRIGDFFAAFPDHDEAVRGVADHIRHFWTPAMRAEFLQALDRDGAAVSDLVREAVTTHRDTLVPSASES